MKKRGFDVAGIIILGIALFLIFGCGERQKGGDAEKPKAEERRGTVRTQPPMLLNLPLSDLEGKEHRLIDYVGEKPILLVFWFSGCGHCLTEIPELNKIFTEKGNEVRLFSINLSDPPMMAKYTVKGKGIKYPVLLDKDGITARILGIRGVPTHVVVDLKGELKNYGPYLAEALKHISG